MIKLVSENRFVLVLIRIEKCNSIAQLVPNMSRLNPDTRKNILHKWYEEQWSSRKIAKFFDVSPTTVLNTIKKWKETSSVTDKVPSNRPKGPKNPRLEKKVLKTIKSDRSISLRKLAKKHGCSVHFIQNVKARNHIKSFKKQKVPKKAIEQKQRARIRSGRLYRFMLENKERCIIMDDETYVYLDTQRNLHTQFYMAAEGEDVSQEEKTIPTGKFDKKAMVWQAICTCGKRSTVFYTLGTITAEIYIKECIKKRVVPLARSHDVTPLFWPDLATSHYAKETLRTLEELGIETIPRELNPPNSPELRPIEKYWAICKRQVFEIGGVAKDLAEFKKIWARATKKVTEEVVQNLMRRLLVKVRSFYRG